MSRLEQELKLLQRLSDDAAQREAERDVALAQELGDLFQRPAVSTTCPDCTHGYHVHPLGFWQYCSDQSCLCHVDPCPQCGQIIRFESDDAAFENVCPNCGYRQTMVAFA